VNKRISFLLITAGSLSIVVFLTSCASAPPVIKSIPLVSQAQYPVVPNSEDLSRSFVINRTATDTESYMKTLPKEKNSLFK
jgi:hypothetical protein